MGRIVLALAASSIVMILLADASTGISDACTPPAGVFKRFEQTPERKPAPSVAFVENEGTERTFAQFRDSGLIVNFWATWCAPCVKEMPALDRLRAMLAADGIEVLALSADREGAPVVREFFDKNGIRNLPVTVDRRGRIGQALSLQGLPTTVLYDREGFEIGRVLGIADWERVETVRFLRACLGGATDA